MKSILHQQRSSSIAAAGVTMLLGIVLVCWPDRSVQFLCTLLGVATFISGIIYSLGWFSRQKEGLAILMLLPSVILCALGIWLMSRPASLVVLTQYIFGGILIFHAVMDLQGALVLMGRRWGRWWLDVLLGVLTLVLGIIILFNPFGTFAALVILIGGALIYDGVSDLFLIWRLSRAFDQREKEGRDGQ